MEHIALKLGKSDEYDRAVHGDDKVRSLPQGGDIEITTKDDGTVGGNAIAVIHWTTELDGKVMRCQGTTTVALLMMAAAGLSGRYDERGKLREHLRGSQG
jgi:hypothetical protein